MVETDALLSLLTANQIEDVRRDGLGLAPVPEPASAAAALGAAALLTCFGLRRKRLA